MPTLERGDWVRARDGSPEVIIVDRVEDYLGQPCAVDARGGGVVLDVIDEVRKANGVRWCRLEDARVTSAGPDDT